MEISFPEAFSILFLRCRFLFNLSWLKLNDLYSFEEYDGGVAEQEEWDDADTDDGETDLFELKKFFISILFLLFLL